MAEVKHHHVLAMDGRGWSVFHLADGNIMLDLSMVCLICCRADFTTLTRMIAAGLSIYTTGDIIACAGPRRVFYACEHNVLVLLFDQTILRLFAAELPMLASLCHKAVATLGPVPAEERHPAPTPDVAWIDRHLGERGLQG